VIRPADEWATLERTHRLTAESPEAERRYLRALYASARPVELDGQGRLLLDGEHRRWAQIGDRAVFVGMGSCIEVVGESVWDAEQAGLDPAAFTALNDRVIARSGSVPGGGAPPA
jgi:DNA-binding transcriptional regulator/RsmH inhibitor MraZ